MTHYIKTAFYSVFIVLLGITPLSAELIRAALDVGSGQTKMTVAVVDEKTGRPTQVLFAEETPVLLGHSFKQSKDGRLSDQILGELEKVLMNYHAIAIELGANELSGVATAVFRESKNGADFIHTIKAKLGLPLQLISQEEEGRMGFLTAVAASGKEAGDIIAWDTGGASFQITTQDGEGLEVYKGPWGASKVLAAIIDVQGNDFTKIQTANPAKLEHVVALQKIILQSLPAVSTKLQNRFTNPAVEVIAIGGSYSAFQIAAQATKRNTYTKEQIWQAIVELTGRTDEELAHFPEPGMVIPRLTLVYTVMKQFNIPRVHSFPTVGSTLGILMSPQLWEAREAVSH